GYTYNWPVDLGPTPWHNGKGDQVRVLEYVPGGLVAAAPGGGMWFHQHFGIGSGPLRLMAWFGPFGRGTGREPGRPGEDVLDKNGMNLEEGGSSIPYWDEDPYVRTDYVAALRREGVELRMDESFYRRPPAGAERAPTR
ncbi:MAG: cupin, partial [bacterium]